MKQARKSNKSNDYLCGLHAIEICFQQQDNPAYLARPRELWVNDLRHTNPHLIQWAKKNNIPVTTHTPSKDQTDDISRDLTQYHQILWIDVKPNAIETFDWDKAETLVIVDHITDTQNLGAIIRSACALGVDALFYPKHTQAPLTPRVRFIAQGATEFLPAYSVNNINQLMAKAKDHGFWIYGFAEEGTSSLYQTQFSQKSVFIIGSEDNGIRKQTLQLCDFVVKIPSETHFSCLNAASAASIVFYERHRQDILKLK